MKVYLASRYSRREEMRAYADQLNKIGHDCHPKWLTESHELHEENKDDIDTIARLALDDYNDLRAADVVIVFTEETNTGRNRGGRHVELGMALAWNKKVAAVGPRENVFYYHPAIEVFDSFAEVVECLGADILWQRVTKGCAK